jgi:hypothetical protein
LFCENTRLSTRFLLEYIYCSFCLNSHRRGATKNAIKQKKWRTCVLTTANVRSTPW